MKKNKPLISMKLLFFLLVISIIIAIFYQNFYECCMYQYDSSILQDECIKRQEKLNFIFNFCGYIQIFIFFAISLNFIYDVINNIKEKNKEQKNFNTKIIIKRLFLGTILMILATIVIFTKSIFETSDKPLIYLYPEEEIKVEVKLGYKDKLTTTYPKYKDSWNVIAKPNGDLIDIETGRSLYGLYWEGLNTVETNKKYGFVIKGEDTIEFLEEKLRILGLSEREANEFIIYWLPKLEHNKYNYIRFQTIEEINENMPLEITPTPDTIIRVLMEYKPLDSKIEVKEQILETPKREGFTVVEWGGSEIK